MTGDERGASPSGGSAEILPDRSTRALDQAAILVNADLDIAAAALGLARLKRVGLDLTPYFVHLDAAADSVRHKVDRNGREPSEALSAVLAGGFRYRGDAETYDDPANADLTRVIERRKGLPVALGIIWISTARAVGWAAEGLDVPGHFLIRIAGANAVRVLDPFHGGRIMGPDDVRSLLLSLGSAAALDTDRLEALPDRDVLLRLQNNKKLRCFQAGQIDEGLACLETMRRVAPDRADLVHEQAAVLAKAGSVKRASDILRGYLQAGHGSAPDRDERNGFWISCGRH